MRVLRLFILLFLFAAVSPAQQLVSFSTQDGATVFAHLYGNAKLALVLAHGARFNKESWHKQARVLEQNGFCVLAIDFRGYGQSKGPGGADPLSAPLQFDVLAAVRYLRKNGALTVSVMGASMGGYAASRAAVLSEAAEIDRLVFLAGVSNDSPEKMKGRKLFIIARDDASGSGPRLPDFRARYQKAPEPKELIILEGSAHAQFLFDTDQGPRLMREILRFLSAP